MKYIKKMSSAPLEPINGSVVDTFNVENKTTNAPSVRAVEDKLSYSTEEKQIGYWIDNRPLYRKVIVVTNLVKDGSEQIVEIIPNIREVRSVVGTQTTSGGMTSNMPLLWENNVSSRNSMVWADVQTAQTYVKYKVNSGWTSLSKITITLEYTKTTD